MTQADRFPHLWVVCLFVAMVFGGRVPNVDAAAPKGIRIYETRQAAPPLRVEGESGDRLSRLDLHGKVVVVSFWATWCAPCKAEMPSMDQLYRDLGDQGMVILGIAVDDSEQAVQNFQRRAHTPINFPLIADETNQIAQHWSVVSVPLTYVLDRQGRIAIRVAGEMDWQSAKIVEPIRNLLGESAVGSK